MSRHNSPRGAGWPCRFGPSLAVATLAQLVCLADPTVLYETRFERIEGFSADADLIGQGNWVGEATDLTGQKTLAGGNGVLAEPVFGFEGQYAYIGFDAPPKTADFNVWRPINLKPVGQPLPVIRFEVSFQINDSSAAAPYFDDFRWSLYNASNQRLLSLDFDNEDLGVNYILDDQRGQTPPAIVPTGFLFAHYEPYDLQIDLNLQRNLWTARINGMTIANALPITTVGAPLTLGDIDAVWVIRTPGKPGDNFMLFDDYRISVLDVAEIPPSVEAVGMLTTGTFVVRVLGEPGVTYRLESATLAASGPTDWKPVTSGVAQSPGGYVDLQDPEASQYSLRTYRAVSVR